MAIEHVHVFEKSDKEGYEVCTGCGGYHSIAQADPKSIYEDNYWSHEKGRSTILEQIGNLTETETCGISKVEKVLEYVPEKGTVLEIACAPGALLHLLMLTGRDAYGIEPSSEYISFIKENSGGATIIEGYFPDVFQKDKKNIFDCIIGLDIFEHVDDYDSFIRAVWGLLKPGGIGIFMSPIILEDGLYRDCDFEVPEQHCWIHTKTFLDPYLKLIFSSVEWTRWQTGHEMFILKK